MTIRVGQYFTLQNGERVCLPYGTDGHLVKIITTKGVRWPDYYTFRYICGCDYSHNGQDWAAQAENLVPVSP